MSEYVRCQSLVVVFNRLFVCHKSSPELKNSINGFCEIQLKSCKYKKDSCLDKYLKVQFEVQIFASVEHERWSNFNVF